ncbi:MAG: TonB-dependent receptor [Prevotella sp.]|nr:TonB-dependent receptor [Bacteroides sp.]MCM1365918.1 TonB-dependent receptor [Prevotella sp.]MCM1436661.1 TonB-dependent receptor [Prevotella sp.]
MTLRRILFTGIIMCPLLTLAKGNITGMAVNKTTGEPMDYANIQLINANTHKPLAIGGTTDDQGYFEINDVPDGKYLVRVSSIGSVDQERPVTIAGKNVEIGTIRLSDDTKMLEEVVVTGVKSQMKFELDRKVFTVDSSIAAAGQSASELLESIPSVEVDQDGEVSLRGNSSVTVWINGKESGLTADNRAQILEQIPGETIERIEVITNPSAKYSPEGSAGIINIVLKKDRRGGYFGSAEIGGNTRGGANTGVSINYNNAKWDTFASASFRMRHGGGGSESNRRYFDGTDENGDYNYTGDYLTSEGKNRNHGNNVFIRLGATYHLTENDDISASAFGMLGHNWRNSNTEYHTNAPAMKWYFDKNLNRSTGDMRGAHAELGYTHRWSDTNYIDFSAAYNHWGGPQWSSYYELQKFASSIDTPTEYEKEQYQEQNQNIGTNSAEIKLDYTNQLTSWLKLEAGFNGNYSHENTPVRSYLGTNKEDLSLNTDLFNTFLYTNNISALYFTLGGKYKSFSFSAGLRGEAWQVRTRSLAYGQDKEDVPQYSKNLFSLFPSAFISWSLPHDNEMQINYTRRIRRPWGGMLNSFRNISDPTNISYGNPELEPAYSNSFEINYIKSWTWHMISASAYLRTNEHMFNRISFIQDGIMYTTEANVANQQNAGLEIVVKNSFLGGKLDFTTTGNIYYSHMDSWETEFLNNGTPIPVSGKSQSQFTWDIREMVSVRLPWGLSLQATGRYRSRQLQAQGSRGADWSVDAGIRKNLGNWSFSLNCRDIFDSRNMASTSWGDGYEQYSKRWRNGRNLSLTIKYSFGNMKPKRDKNSQIEPSMDNNYNGTEEF